MNTLKMFKIKSEKITIEIGWFFKESRKTRYYNRHSGIPRAKYCSSFVHLLHIFSFITTLYIYI